MRIREENCNLLLLILVTVFSTAIAGGASLLAAAPESSPDKKTVYVADRSADRSPVRVVGAPFVPNTNPRER
jgi:capsular polysaccharide biosynthesis protein